MRKILVLLFSLLFTVNVNAASLCSYQEEVDLKNEASNIKVSYEIKTGKQSDLDDFPGMESTTEYIEVSILNISKNFWVRVRNDKDSKITTYSFSDVKNGLITFKVNDVSEIHKYTFDVFTSNATSCANEAIRTIYFSTPRYNSYSERAICNEMSGFYLCQKYVDFSEVKESAFYKQLDSYKKGEVNENGEDIKDESGNILTFIKNNKWYFVGGVVIVAALSVTFLTKRRKKRNLV